jgi:hypothetical protein
MRIVPMHQWKVPLKYRAMLLFPSGPLELGGAADTMVWGGVPTKWREQKSTSTYILNLRRNSTGVPYYVTEASSCRHCHCRCRCLPLTTCHLPLATRHHYNHGRSVASSSLSLSSSSLSLPSPPSPPPSVIYLIVEFVLSLCPLPFLIRWWPSHPLHPPSSSLPLSSSWLSSPLLPSSSSLPTTPPPRDLFDCCVHALVPRRVISP